jgi:outer membrane protein OmpA-like peptidoglycan-associated protein
LISNITDYTCSDITVTEQMFAGSDTAYINVNCEIKDAKIVGAIIDENGASLSCSVTIENILTGEKVSSISTNPKGEFIANVRPGLSYRFTPNKKSYIPQAIEVLSDVTKPGATIPLQLQMIGINRAIVDGMTFSLKNIFFDSNKSDIKSESELELRKLIQFLTENPTVCLEIAAHTDNVGKITDNLALSQRRAESVVNYLQANGIEKLRLKAKGYGETKHIASNEDEAGRLLNRRVEFALFNCN